MENIWGIILQTLTVSVTAVLLLLLKWLMADKLSPRWQYGVWSVLALRILVPVSVSRNIFGPLPIWIEALKAAVERHLSSAYSAEYEPIAIGSLVPQFRGMPVSVTDWLFVLYGVGVAVSLLRYLYAYQNMRKLLRHGTPVTREIPETQGVRERIRAVCRKYQLKPCRAVAVEGLPSAFVIGVFRPILAVPAGEEVDGKVLLHELLHVKHRDMLLSIFWCVLRSLHWFNPLMQYVFDRIANDMESLCDQRVLERLEGEERREYGAILLGMANDRYARVPGTSAVSNGGKNIARRIEAIVRFQKYPQGMAVVSVCVILLTMNYSLVGTATNYGDYYRPEQAEDLTLSMAMARMNRCTTLAGALDTYAKGLKEENGVLIAMASPAEVQEKLRKMMAENARSGEHGVGWVDCGEELSAADGIYGYKVFNLKRQADGSYEGLLVLYMNKYVGGEQFVDETGVQSKFGSLMIPVRAREENGWVVEECGRREFRLGTVEEYDLDPTRLIGEGENGTLSIEITAEYRIGDSGLGEYTNLDTDSAELSVDTDAQFEETGSYLWRSVVYRTSETLATEGAQNRAKLVVKVVSSLEEEVEYPEVYPYSNGSTADSLWGSKVFTAGFDGVISISDGILLGTTEVDAEGVFIPKSYKARIYWRGELIDEIWLEGETDE